jgi:hypothetical protein
MENLKEALYLFFILAVVCEVLTDIVKGWLQQIKPLTKEVKRYVSIVIAIAIGIIYALQTGTSLLVLLGFPVMWMKVDIVMSGLFLAFGSNAVHILLKLFMGWTEIIKAKSSNELLNLPNNYKEILREKEKAGP